MSENYLATGTMALPDQPETDYNSQVPLWEQLDLPYGPEYLIHNDGLQVPATEVSKLYIKKEESKEETLKRLIERSKTLPISLEKYTKKTAKNFKKFVDDIDQEIIENFKKEVPLQMTFDESVTEPTATDNSGDALEIDDFFNQVNSKNDIDEEELAEEQEDVSDDVKATREYSDSAIEYQENAPLPRLDKSKSTTRWKTPQEWLDDPKFRNHVGYEVWSNYDDAAFEEADDQWWDEDVFLAQSVLHINAVTDMYLADHTKLTEGNDERKYWNRLVTSKLTNSNMASEPIPSFLMPDKDRGVEYTDEVIEMKGKLSLQARQELPEIEYASDSFTHNEELIMLNKIGTVREQYDWAPTDADYAIEEDKVLKILPLLSFANHIAELLSIKVFSTR